MAKCCGNSNLRPANNAELLPPLLDKVWTHRVIPPVLRRRLLSRALVLPVLPSSALPSLRSCSFQQASEPPQSESDAPLRPRRDSVARLRSQPFSGCEYGCVEYKTRALRALARLFQHTGIKWALSDL